MTTNMLLNKYKVLSDYTKELKHPSIRISLDKSYELYEALHEDSSNIRSSMRSLVKAVKDEQVILCKSDDEFFLQVHKSLVDNYLNIKEGQGLTQRPEEAAIKYLEQLRGHPNVLTCRENGHVDRFKPDYSFELRRCFVICEIDEDQHKSYDQLGEYLRMLAITKTLAKPCVFIRCNLNTESVPLHNAYRKLLTDTVKNYLKYSSEHYPAQFTTYVVYLFYGDEPATTCFQGYTDAYLMTHPFTTPANN
jgi:hypothetical protein